MTGLIANLFDRLRGTGAHSVTTPPMDGALQPNRAIEAAELVAETPAPDNLVALGGDILFSSRDGVFRLSDPCTAIHRFDAPVSALAVSPGGVLAIGLEDGSIALRGGPHGGGVLARENRSAPRCPTAILFEDEDTLLVCDGSAANSPGRWRHDLMQRESSGMLRRLRMDGSAETLATGLAFPNGLLKLADGTVVVAEAWRSRLLRFGRAGAAPSVVLDDLPGYPARLTPRRGGGAFLAVFAPRSQLIEFVLRETGYREAMMRDVPEDHWIAPALQAPHSFLEPMQGGALKQLGTLKPWAPTRSFGLVVALDDDFRPVASWHSRADGSRHGVTSCLQHDDGTVLIAAKGGDAILELNPDRKVAR